MLVPFHPSPGGPFISEGFVVADQCAILAFSEGLSYGAIDLGKSLSPHDSISFYETRLMFSTQNSWVL